MSEKDAPSGNSVQIIRGLKEVQTNEIFEGIEQIRRSREKLSEFTNRDMHDAIFGSTEYTDLLLGKDGGNEKMKNIDLRIDGSGRIKAIGAETHQVQLEDQTRMNEILEENYKRMERDHLNNPEFSKVALERKPERVSLDEQDFAELLDGLSEEEIAQLKSALGKV